ncbi:MAG: hypothetical protein ACOX8Q_04020 [Christensenellales bacterium]|jgi:hypothetical protein
MVRKSSLRRALLTNICLILIILFVYFTAFMPFKLTLQGPFLKGNTGQKNIALQIGVNVSSDIRSYINVLDTFGVKGTFFFSELSFNEKPQEIQHVIKKGHGIGYYISKNNDRQRLTLYIGGGYSIPVMSYVEGSNVLQVCPSIDIAKLKSIDDWQQVLNDNIINDMFIYINADNNFEDLKNVVQIVLNKGYTILKINEML